MPSQVFQNQVHSAAVCQERGNIPVSSRTENGTSTVARLADPSEWRKPIVEITD